MIVRESFLRVSLKLTVRRTDEGGVTVQFTLTDADGKRRVLGGQTVSARVVARWRRLGPKPSPQAIIPGLARTLGLAAHIKQWERQLDAANPLPTPDGPTVLLPCILLEITDPELAQLNWEGSLVQRGLRPCAIVRHSEVRTRALLFPLTLPIRITHVRPPSKKTTGIVSDSVRQVFGGHPPAQVRQAMQVREISSAHWGDLREWRQTSRQPTTEIIHFDTFPALSNPTQLLSMASAEKVGTLAWLMRLTDVQQTRLVVIHCANARQAAAARRLGEAVVGRGGPAVLIESLRTGAAQAFYQQLYEKLIHDKPLDTALYEMHFGSFLRGSAIQAQVSLFVGGGRAESLRISSIAQRIDQAKNQVTAARDNLSGPDANQWREVLERRERASYRGPGQSKSSSSHSGPPGSVRAIAFDDTLQRVDKALQSIQDENLTFDRERTGMIPIAKVLRRAKDPLRPTRPRAVTRETITTRTTPTTQTDQRFINAAFWHEAVDSVNPNADSTLEKLDPESTRLQIGQTYHLGVNIGPRDEAVQMLDAVALVEEVFKWTPTMKGVWLEVGITGLDFEVMGEPVQALWLPRDSPSETIYFAASPKLADASRLRICLYFQNNLIQSFVVAALAQVAKPKPTRLAKLALKPRERGQLARKLEVSESRIGNIGYLARLEFSLTTSHGGIESRPKRHVSIFANDHEGQTVITLKVDEIGTFAVNEMDKPISDFVQNLRNALEKISTPAETPEAYGFASDNSGDEAKLTKGLMKLAEHGWRLYDKLIPRRAQGMAADTDQRAKLEQYMSEESRVIEIAHAHLEKAPPWSALYDRLYDADARSAKQADATRLPVAFKACVAAKAWLTADKTDKPDRFPKCGEHPQCPLHPDNQAKLRAAEGKVVTENTVACLQHFWGFSHIIEVPPQQVGDNGAAHEQQDCVLFTKSEHCVGGLSKDLNSAQDDRHPAALEAKLKSTPNDIEWQWLSDRDEILEALKNDKLYLAYFFCHAYRDKNSGVAYLEFRQKDKSSLGRISDDQLSSTLRWKQHPLVFLNACQTTAYSPETTSPFIAKFIERGASGLIGTEIEVWESLSTEVGETFLVNFMKKGSAAGIALLNMRRALLAKNNPLGLVYTLYAASHLKFDADGDGKCN